MILAERTSARAGLRARSLPGGEPLAGPVTGGDYTRDFILHAERSEPPGERSRSAFPLAILWELW